MSNELKLEPRYLSDTDIRSRKYRLFQLKVDAREITLAP